MQSSNYVISVIRLISTCLVITCHIMQYLDIELAWWFNVGVQVFMCISGYLYGQKDVGDVPAFYARRFKKILIPYYIVFIPYGILQFLFARDIFSLTTFAKGILINATLSGAGHLWFVHTILLCYVLTPLLQTYVKHVIKNRKSFITFTVIAVEIVSIFFGIFNGFYNPAWMCCYVIGYVLGVNKLNKYISEKTLATFAVIIAIIGNGIQVYCSYISHVQFPGYHYFCDYNHMFLGVAIFPILKFVLSKVELKRTEGLLSISDKYSYEIYLVHHLIILGPFSMMAVTQVIGLNIALILILTFILAVAVKKVSNMLAKYI